MRKWLDRAILSLAGLSEQPYVRQVSRQYGFGALDTFDSQRTWPTWRLPELILCPQAFDFARPPRQDRFFVDFSIRPDSPEAGNFEEVVARALHAGAPLIYCSFGSRIPGQRRAKKILDGIIDIFSRQDRFHLLVRIGSKSEARSLHWVPSHVTVVDGWLPQQAILRCATVHITHGGFASVRESIECEVPMLVIPFDTDHHGNAARVVHYGLGLRVFRRYPNGKRLLKLVCELADSPVYKERLRAMKADFDLQRRRKSAADVIESLLARSCQNSPSTEPNSF